jgi:hypothetical protein
MIEPIRDIKDLFTSVLGSSPELVEFVDDPEEKNAVVEIIDILDSLCDRHDVLYDQYNIDLTTIEAPYWAVLGKLLGLYFDKNFLSWIFWYLNERFDENGDLLPVTDSEGNQVYIENSIQLYNFALTGKI